MPSRSTRFISVTTFVALVAATPTLAQDAREADHQELRQLLATVRDAINAQQIEKLEPLVAEKFSIILADAQLVTSLKDLKAYYQRLTDPGSGVLKSLTVNPSRMLKLDGRIGAIERGRDADLVLFTGDPFSPASRVKYVIVDGKIVYEAP